jgi:phage-related protein
MNFLGLGFSFGGKDKGMSAAIENQTKGLGLMGKAVKTLDSILSINRLQTFIDAISLSRLKDISDGIENISSTGRNLTTGLEAEFQSNSRSMAAFGVSVGYSGAELKKFKKESSSAAYETGISIDQMGKAFYGFEPAAKTLSKLGIDGGKDFAKFAEVAGVDAQKFGWGLGQMQKQLGLTEDQMALMTAQAAKFGQSTGDLSGALNDLPQMAEMLNARKALGDSPEAITQFGQQIYGLGEALYATGVQDAGGFSKHLAKTMTDSKKSFKDLFAGVGDDLSGFQQELMVSGLDAQKVFGAMEQGPADFMKVMAEQAEMVAKNGGDVGKALEFMRGRMSQTFGEEQTNQIVTALSDPVKRGAMMAIKTETNAQGALGKIVKEGYEGRFTLAEQFERSETMMVHRFRQIGKKETVAFVKSSQHAFKQFGDTLEKLAKDDKSPLGAVVRKLSEAHQIGAQAFIPEVMRPLVTLTGSAVKEMGPMLGILGSLGFRFTMLLNPVTLIIGALGILAFWFASLRLSGKSTDEALAEMGVTIMTFFLKLPIYVERAVEGLSGFLDSLMDIKSDSKWVKFAGAILGSMKNAFERIGKVLGPFLSKYGGKLLNFIGESLKTYAPVVLKALLDTVGWALSSLWKVLPGMVLGGLQLLTDVVLGAWDMIREYFVNKFPESAGSITAFFNVFAATFQAISTVAKAVFGLLFDSFKIVFSFFDDRMHSTTSIWEDTWEAMGALFKEWYMGIYYDWVNLFTDVKVLWGEFTGFLSGVWDGLKSGAQSALAVVGALFTAAVDTFVAPFKAIDEWIDDLFRHSISSDIEDDLKEALKIFDWFSKGAGKVLDMVMAPLSALLPSVAGVGGGPPKAVPPGGGTVPAVSAADREAGLVAAVHNPMWYGRYERVFAAHMAALTRAVQESGSGNGVKGGKKAGGKGVASTKEEQSNLGLYINMTGDLVGG